MSRFSKGISPYVLKEIRRSKEAEIDGNYSGSFNHLENAHVLGQESTYWHVKVHWLMLRWGFRQKNANEVFGQIVRIVGAAMLTSVKGVPTGNTGGSNVSPIKPMPISAAHEEIIARAKKNA